MKKTIAIISQNDIENRIFNIRGVAVVLDKDLAFFYDVKPIRLREQVKRNSNRFPDDFMFQLSESEIEIMVSQNAIPSKQYLGGHLPYVFTEQGVAAVSAVIKSAKAAEVSISIMRAFVKMRKFILNNASIFQRLDKIELKQIEAEQKFEKIFEALESNNKHEEKGIFFEGQIFDAYTFISKLIKQAKSSIILIDNYIDESVLTLLTKRNDGTKAFVYTKQINKQLELDLKKHNAQYDKIEIKILDNCHDRFLIIDQKELYHIGASIKDIGKKWVAFSKMDSLTNDILNKLQ